MWSVTATRSHDSSAVNCHRLLLKCSFATCCLSVSSSSDHVCFKCHALWNQPPTPLHWITLLKQGLDNIWAFFLMYLFLLFCKTLWRHSWKRKHTILVHSTLLPGETKKRKKLLRLQQQKTFTNHGSKQYKQYLIYKT